MEPLMVTTLLTDLAYEQGTDMHILALDIRRAYDSMCRVVGKEMCMRRMGIPERAIDFFRILDPEHGPYLC